VEMLSGTSSSDNCRAQQGIVGWALSMLIKACLWGPYRASWELGLERFHSAEVLRRKCPPGSVSDVWKHNTVKLLNFPVVWDSILAEEISMVCSSRAWHSCSPYSISAAKYSIFKIYVVWCSSCDNQGTISGLQVF